MSMPACTALKLLTTIEEEVKAELKNGFAVNLRAGKIAKPWVLGLKVAALWLSRGLAVA